MKTNLDKFKTSSSLEESGVWFDYGEAQFLVRRFGGYNAPKIKAAMAKHFKPYAQQIKMDILPIEKEKEIMAKIFIDSCLVDWKGVEIDGAAAAYSPEVALQLLTALPDLADSLQDYAKDLNNYSKEDLGNS